MKKKFYTMFSNKPPATIKKEIAKNKHVKDIVAKSRLTTGRNSSRNLILEDSTLNQTGDNVFNINTIDPGEKSPSKLKKQNITVKPLKQNNLKQRKKDIEINTIEGNSSKYEEEYTENFE